MTTRSELFSRLGILNTIVEPILRNIYELEEEQIWRRNLHDSPHGEKWHTSFHASSFPGDNPKACARAALYTMMDIPAFDPIDPHGRAIMESGKAVEEMIVWRFANAGILISDSPDAKHQMGFVDEEHWLTGSPDAIIRTPKNGPHVVEIKSKDERVLQEMRSGGKSFDAPHRSQILTYIGLVNEYQQGNISVYNAGKSTPQWDGFDDITTGTLLYASRDRPRTTHEYKFKYNPDFMEEGKIKLKLWQKNYLDEELPPRDKDWRWTELPCKYCNVKKICKEDYKNNVTKLENSCGVKHAEEVRGEYDYSATRKAVLDRWKVGRGGSDK